MPICVRYLLPGLLAALLPNPWLLPAALAQKADSPLFLPTTDVAVTYRYDGEMTGGVRMMQITYAEKGERVRINYFRWAEAKYPFLGLIFDRPANRLISVQPERKAYIDRQIGDTSNPGKLLPPDVQFIRQGISVVAHAPCTDWKLALSRVPSSPLFSGGPLLLDGSMSRSNSSSCCSE
jgi:hypothetical protein